jgi:hypothetical protein
MRFIVKIQTTVYKNVACGHPFLLRSRIMINIGIMFPRNVLPSRHSWATNIRSYIHNEPVLRSLPGEIAKLLVTQQ